MARTQLLHSQVLRKLLQRGQRQHLLFELLVATVACLYFSEPAHAAKTVILQYADRRVTVPLTELQAFVEDGEETAQLREFVQRIPASEAFSRQILVRDLPVRFAPSGDQQISRNAQFILYQINKLVGKPSGEENYPALRKALIEASTGRRGLTILRLLETYPEATVRVDLLNLERVFTDISLYLERLQPLLQSQQLINDWFCECPAAPSPITTALASPASLTSSAFNCDPTSPKVQMLQAEAIELGMSEDGQTMLAVLLALEWLTQPAADADDFERNWLSVESQDVEAENLANSAARNIANHRSEDRSDHHTAKNKRLIFRFGPFGRSISIEELTHFAETGEASRALQSYLQIANLEPANFRAILNQQIVVDFRLIDRALSSLPGEYALFRISDVLHTRSREADIQALRSALLLSARDDNRISPIEFLQHFPTQQIYVNGVVLLRAVQFARRTLEQDLGPVTGRVADWLENVQRAVAAEICDCQPLQTEPNPIETEPYTGSRIRTGNRLPSTPRQSAN